jgi:ATP phosphoribosyltransferase
VTELELPDKSSLTSETISFFKTIGVKGHSYDNESKLEVSVRNDNEILSRACFQEIGIVNSAVRFLIPFF